MVRLRVFSAVVLSLITISTKAQLDSNFFKLPELWTKDFVITLSYHSSMGGSKTEVKFTFDSCIYFNQSFHDKKPRQHIGKLKEADRIAILKKLKDLKMDQIKTEVSIQVVRDGWSQSICLNDYCIEGGTAAGMRESDKNIFLEAYRFLEEFAMKNTK